jgi:DNA-binding beta-propeller fold protein YncE
MHVTVSLATPSCILCLGALAEGFSVARAGLVSTIGGSVAGFLDGPADQARFHYPHSAAVSPDGAKLFVSDGWNQRIRVVSLKDGAHSLPHTKTPPQAPAAAR